VTSSACGHKASALPAFLLLLAALAAPIWAQAGTLSLGQPSVEGTQYVFPVALGGADAQVSALDFRLQFDPRVFVPISATAGPAALAANKMVSANNSAPGQFVVVMMGLNQSTIPSGLVASVLFQRTGDGDGAAATTVGIADLTLAGPDGNELPASGSSVSVPLRESTPADETEGEEEGSSDPDATPETPAPTNETPVTESPTAETPARRMLAGAPADNAEGPTPAVPSVPAAPMPAGGAQTSTQTGTTPASATPQSPDTSTAPAIPGAEGSAGMRSPLPLPKGNAQTNVTTPDSPSETAGSTTDTKPEMPAAKTRIAIGGTAPGDTLSDNAEAVDAGESAAIPPFVWPLGILGLLLLIFAATRRLRGRR